MSKFDDAIAAAKAAHFDEPEVIQLIELIVAQNERLKNVEHFTLEAKSRMGVSEKIQNEHTESITSLSQTRDDNVKRLVTIEGKPEADKKKLEDLEKRVTVVEGAVGSKAYRRAETKNAETPLVPATDIPEPKPRFWSASETPKPAVPA